MRVTIDRECLADYWALAGAVAFPAQARTILYWASPSTRGGPFVTVQTEITNN